MLSSLFCLYFICIKVNVVGVCLLCDSQTKLEIKLPRFYTRYIYFSVLYTINTLYSGRKYIAMIVNFDLLKSSKKNLHIVSISADFLTFT